MLDHVLHLCMQSQMTIIPSLIFTQKDTIRIAIFILAVQVKGIATYTNIICIDHTLITFTKHAKPCYWLHAMDLILLVKLHAVVQIDVCKKKIQDSINRKHLNLFSCLRLFKTSWLLLIWRTFHIQ